MNQYFSALFFLTNCLSRNIDRKTVLALRSQIIKDDVPWEQVVELANNHLLGIALWISLSNKQLVDDLPHDLVVYLKGLYQLNKERNTHLHKQLLEAVKALNEVGIEPVLLKGAAHLVTDIYSDQAARIMSDIDILVKPGQLEAAYDCLLDLNYLPDENSLDDYLEDHHHYPPLFRSRDFAALEIHRKLMEGYADILSTEEVLQRAIPIELDGFCMKMLSPTDRILHNIIHSQLVDRHYSMGMIPLRSLSEVALESNNHAISPDWKFIIQRMTNNGHREVIQSYLFMANKLFKMPSPEGYQQRIREYLYFFRCIGQLAWVWFDRWGMRWGRFSTENICRIYGCSNDIVALNQARVRHFIHLTSGYLSRKFMLKSNGY